MQTTTEKSRTGLTATPLVSDSRFRIPMGSQYLGDSDERILVQRNHGLIGKTSTGLDIAFAHRTNNGLVFYGAPKQGSPNRRGQGVLGSVDAYLSQYFVQTIPFGFQFNGPHFVPTEPQAVYTSCGNINNLMHQIGQWCLFYYSSHEQATIAWGHFVRSFDKGLRRL